MDTLTHALLGALVVRVSQPAHRSPYPFSDRQRLLAGALAGAFPDIDYIASWVDPMVYLTLWHRSVTHSFVLLPLWALLAGVLLALLFRQRRAWLYLTALAGLALVSHILSDLITVYGTQVFSPLSAYRASVGTTFVIDPWFTLIVFVGVIAGAGRPMSRLPAASLALLLAYVLSQAGLKAYSYRLAEVYADEAGLHTRRITILPQPFSPFNWKLVIATEDSYTLSYVNLLGGYSGGWGESGFWAKVRDTYRSPARMNWQHQAKFGDGHEADLAAVLWLDGRLDYFRRFAELPALYRIDRNAGKVCVWFTDLRYVLPYMRPPFRYGLCGRETAADWVLERLRD